MVVTFFEADYFGAIGYFLVYVDLITDSFNELVKTDFSTAANKALDKIKDLKNSHSYFWNTICPIALLLNPSVPFNLLLTSSQISSAKNSILKRMQKYESNKSDNYNDHPSFLDKYFKNSNNTKKAPLEKILDERTLDHTPEALKNFRFEKINTCDRSLALVAIDILGILITSVSSERSFSRGRLVINDQRTRISSEHAKQQMIVQLNQNVSKEVISRLNIIP